MLRNWSWPTFRKILYKEAKNECSTEDVKYTNVFKRLYLYLRSLELRNKGLGYRKIQGVLKGELDFTTTRSNLSDWLRGKHTPIGRINVFDVRAPEAGFLLGMILSDGNERFDKRNLAYNIEFYNTNGDYIEMVKEAYTKLKLPNYIKKDSKGRWRISMKSALLYLLLKHYDEYVMGSDPQLKRAFLKGLWLGDGYIGRNAIRFYNTDLKLIKIAGKLLKLFKVKHTIQGPYKPRPSRKNEYTVKNHYTTST